MAVTHTDDASKTGAPVAAEGGGVSNAIELITASRTYHANSSTGDDSNDGLSAETPFLTLGRAATALGSVATIQSNVTIELSLVGDFSAESPVRFYCQFGGNTIAITGNVVSPGSVLVPELQFNTGNFALSGIYCPFVDVRQFAGVTSACWCDSFSNEGLLVITTNYFTQEADTAVYGYGPAANTRIGALSFNGTLDYGDGVITGEQGAQFFANGLSVTAGAATGDKLVLSEGCKFYAEDVIEADLPGDGAVTLGVGCDAYLLVA